jgi:hypothetical protein
MSVHILAKINLKLLDNAFQHVTSEGQIVAKLRITKRMWLLVPVVDFK